MGYLRRALLTSVAFLAATSSVQADPLTIGVSILVQLGVTGLGAAAIPIATLVGSAVLVGVSFGLNLLSNAIFARPVNRPEPQQRQATLRQSNGPRVRFYGRVKVGGTLWFFEVKNGLLYSAMTVNEGIIGGVREIWFNDQNVEADSGGRVTTPPYERGTGSYVYIFFRLGSPDQGAYPQLTSAFPGAVTEAHRLRGVADVLTIFQETPSELISEIYPRLNPSVRLVIDASMVHSVRTGEYIWSDNNSDCIYDFLTARDGAGFPYGAGWDADQVDLPSFQHYADVCDEQVPLKGGGTVDRYNLWGGYNMNQQIREVLPDMLRAGDADLYLTSEGRIAIRGGEWVEPVLTLDDELGHIINGQFRRGAQALAAFNELTITFVDPESDYLEVEGQRWLDEDNIALRGKVLSSSLELKMVPFHSQARRLAKIHTHKSNPRWAGTITTNFYGFNALNEHEIRVRWSPLGIDETFIIRKATIQPDMTGVQLVITSLSQVAYEWDAVLEEGTGPGLPPNTSTPIDLPPPADINVHAADKVISGSSVGTYIAVTWTEPERVALRQDLEYQLSPDGPWLAMNVADGVGFAESGILTDGATYLVRVRTRAPGGTTGAWTTPVSVVATPDAAAPADVTMVVATPTDVVELGWTNSVSLNSIAARIYRNTVNNSGTATLIHTEYGSPSVAKTYTDDPVAGTYYYWIAALNGSGIQSALVATGAQVVT